MTTKYLNIYELKAAFSYYAQEVLKGKSFIIAMRNKPFAEFRALPARGKKITFGVLRNAFELPKNFNSALPDFERAFYARK